MEKMQNSKVIVSFDQNILSIKFAEGAVVSVEDIKQIYEYGNEKSNGQPYCLLFDHSSDFIISESAVEYASNKVDNLNILAKAYIVNTKDSKIKVRLHLVFDNPIIKPNVFESEIEAINWLNTFLKK